VSKQYSDDDHNDSNVVIASSIIEFHWLHSHYFCTLFR